MWRTITPVTATDASPLVDIDVELRTRHLCDCRITFAEPQVMSTPIGTRITNVVLDGRCEGERLNGTFLAGGGDWVLLGADRVGRLDVRATLQTDDGALVHWTNTGRARLDDDAIRRYSEGESIPARDIYFRSSPLFETGAAPWAWLNSVHTVAINQLSRREVHYRIFEVL